MLPENKLYPKPSEKPQLYVFSCSDETQDESLERNLIGAKTDWALKVIPGNYCFLLNYSPPEKTLLGLFRVSSRCKYNLVKNAWGGMFPYQVKIEMASSEIRKCPLTKFSHIIVDRKSQRVQNIIEGVSVGECLKIFEESALIYPGKIKNLEKNRRVPGN
jgi:hypothetical protein